MVVIKSNATVPFDVVILDYKMPKKDGLQVAKEIFELEPKAESNFCFCICSRYACQFSKASKAGSRTDAKAFWITA
ncbi:MAG: response regulator transcription factor, partial [Nitrososphaeraceae archaeon]